MHVALQLCPSLKLGPRTFQPIEWVVISAMVQQHSRAQTLLEA